MADRPDHLSVFDYDREPEQPYEPPAADGANDQEPKTIPKDRFDELRERLQKSEQRNDELIRSMASGMIQPQQQPTPQGDADGDPSPEIDPDISAYLQRREQEIEDRIRQDILKQFGPALEAAHRNQSIEELDSRVPGFKDQLMQEVEEEYNSLSPEEREMYNSKVGLEALAQRVRIRRMEAQARQSGGPPMGAMGAMPAQSPGHEAPVPSGSAEIDPWSLSPDEFEKFKERASR